MTLNVANRSLEPLTIVAADLFLNGYINDDYRLNHRAQGSNTLYNDQHVDWHMAGDLVRGYLRKSDGDTSRWHEF